jgi:hypothetical protein
MRPPRRSMMSMSGHHQFNHRHGDVATAPGTTAVAPRPSRSRQRTQVGSVNELEVARAFVRQAREAEGSLTGPSGLLKAMTMTAIEPSRTTNPRSIRAMILKIRLDTEVKTAQRYSVLGRADRLLPCDRHRRPTGSGGQLHTAHRRQAPAPPVRYRSGGAVAVCSPGLTTGESNADFADIYDAQVFMDTISRIIDRVLEEPTTRHSRRSGAGLCDSVPRRPARDSRRSRRPQTRRGPR